MYKTWILVIVLNVILFSSLGYVEAEEKGESWKVSVTNADLVVAVNFLMNNKGRDIELAGKQQRITGKEELDVEITILPCCNKEAFRKYISTFGKVQDVKFPIFYATLPADKIPEIDKNSEVMEIKFTPEAHDFWMKAIKEKTL